MKVFMAHRLYENGEIMQFCATTMDNKLLEVSGRCSQPSNKKKQPVDVVDQETIPYVVEQWFNKVKPRSNSIVNPVVFSWDRSFFPAICQLPIRQHIELCQLVLFLRDREYLYHSQNHGDIYELAKALSIEYFPDPNAAIWAVLVKKVYMKLITETI